MLYPDLVWTVLATIGGLLLLGKKWSQFSGAEKSGVVLIYVSFLFQVYWEILHQAVTSPFVWNYTSQLQFVFVTFMVVLSLVIGIYTGRKDRK
jgi:hypothetical protein